MTETNARWLLDLLEAYRPCIQRALPSNIDPEDVFQEVCLIAMTQPFPLEPCWVRRVSLNIAITFGRRERIRRCEDLRLNSRITDRDPTITSVESDENRKIIREKVQSLNRNDRDVIQRKFFSGESLKDVAQELGLPNETVRTRSKRAIERLRAKPELAEIA